MDTWHGRTALAAPVALLVVAPPPVDAAHALLEGGLTPLLSAVALAAWACAGWLMIITVLTLLTQRQGRPGALAERLLAGLAPRALRLTAELALGITVTTALAPVAAHAADTGPERPVSDRGSRSLSFVGPRLDWPSPPAPALDWPVSATAGTPSEHPASPAPPTLPALPTPQTPQTPPTLRTAATHPTPQHSTIVVQPGDCLWNLAARALGGHPSPSRVAAAWPAWWAANRVVIGEDPDLLQPGTRLRPPA